MKPFDLMSSTLAVLVASLTPTLVTAQSGGPLSSRPLALGDEVLVTWYDGGWGTQISAYSSLKSRTLELVSLSPRQFVGTGGNRIYIIETTAVRGVRRRVGTKPASSPAMVAGSAGGFVAAFLVGALGSAGGGAVNSGLSAGVLVGAPIGALVAWVSSRSRGIYEEVPLPRFGRR